MISITKKILIIGSPGAGKTYFSRLLGEKTNIEVFHLDDYFLKKDWKKISDKEINNFYDSVANRKEYILDGSYIYTLSKRMEDATTILWIKRNLFICIYQYTKRYINCMMGDKKLLPKQIREGQQRKLSEKGYLNFVFYIFKFNLIQNKIIKNLLSSYLNKNIYILESKKQINRFLESLEHN